jgi:TonB-dependent receptor
MKSSSFLKNLLLSVASLGLAAGLHAQGTGAITGRVFNPATGEYIRNVEIRIEGTPQIATSEAGGYYRLANAPAGEVTLTATYTGHTTVTAKVNVTAGETATHDFELAPTAATRTDEVVKLGEFVVSSEREGQAKVVSEQKQAMNAKFVVASDNFGDIAEGNIGEFLKFMPGITLDYVETDTRAARMGGLEARYGYVTLDGNTMANAFNGSFSQDQRQFEFETVSINNIESIEVNKTLSADMPGDAPAGTINLRSKSALDRKGQRFSYTAGLIGNQYEYTLHKTPRHDDHPHAKSRPTFVFDYSNSFFGNKLGLSLNGATTSVFKEQFRSSLTYDYNSAQAIAAGHPLITAINFKDGPKMTTKYSGGVKLDYQPWGRNLRFSLATSYTYFSDVIANRNLNFRVSSAQSNTNAELTRVVAAPSGANANTRLEQSGSHGNKKSDNTSVIFGYDFKRGRLSSDGSFGLSRARIQNGSLHMGAVDTANIQLTRIGWTAVRPNNDSASWYFTQDSGASWFDLANWGRNDAQAGNITNTRSRGKTEQYTARLNAKYVMPWQRPTFFQGGLFMQVANRRRDQNYANTFTYVGPTGNQLNAIMPTSIADFRFSQWGSPLGSLPVPDKAALFQLQYTNPTYFSQTVANNAANLETVLSSPQSTQETVRAGYVQANTRLGRWQLQAGGRYEATSTISSVPFIVPVSKNPYAIRNANGTFSAASTIDYVAYKYSKGMTKSWGDYGDFLPSASAKYQIAKNLNLKLGYNKAIKRPNLAQTAGAWSINSADTQITIPNPNLTPERSQKYSAILEYYVEPAGAISLHVFETILNGATETFLETAQEAGFGNDPVYGSYDFISFRNIEGTTRIKGLELSYSQQLTFFKSEWLRGAGVFATYSRFARHPRPTGFIPQNATGGFSYRYRKFSGNLGATWTDENIVSYNSATQAFYPAEPQYLKQRVICDIGLNWQFNRHTSFFVSGRNAFNSGKNWYYKSDHRMQQKERYGGQWTIGVKGNY